MGMGTSTLLKEFEERTYIDQQFDDTLFISVECGKLAGPQTSYSPFIDILEAFHPSNQSKINKKIVRKAIPIIEKNAHDWLPLLPGISSFVKAEIKTATKASDIGLASENYTQADKGKKLKYQYRNTILKIASCCRILVLIISDVQWIDTQSCDLLLDLSKEALRHNLVLILTYHQEKLEEKSPLNDVLSEMRDMRLPMISLKGWSVEEVDTYLRITFGEILDPNLAEWLQDLCNGQPWFINEYLTLLGEKNIIESADGKYKLNGQIKRNASGELEPEGELKNILPPRNIHDVLKERIEKLQEDKQYILQIGAVQGKRFVSVVIERCLSKQKQKQEIMKYLNEIEDQHHLISRCKDKEWTGIKSEEFTFFLTLMQQLIYDKLFVDSRSEIHLKIAKILEEISKDIFSKNLQQTAQQKLMSHIARHYDLGDDPLLASHYYLRAAESAFYDGALKTTSELCQQALDKIRSLPENVEYDKLRGEIIQLKLLASERWWRGNPSGDDPRMSEEESLIEEAEYAALRSNNLSLLARIKFIKGKIFVTTNNLDSAVEEMNEALQMAKIEKDPLAKFFIMSELGHQIVGRRSIHVDTTFDSGLDLQHNAHKFYFENLQKLQLKPEIKVDLDRHLYQLKARIGIAEFDRSDYGKAIQWLVDSIDGIKQLKRQEDQDLSWPLNFLAQVYTAIGQFEDAEKKLKEAIALQNGEEEPSAVRGNNWALLGKLYMEWGRIKDAEKPLTKGWKETQDAWMVAVVPVVRNYYAELLMHPEYKSRDLSMAERLLWDTIKDVDTTKFYRSKILAFSLLGKLALTQTDIGSAVKYSTKAIDDLQKMKIMPLLRMEEVFFNHYCALRATPDRQSEAKSYLKNAHNILQQKANSLKNEKYKNTFLDRVPISREILSAVNS
jgi:predicted ATPase